jgi:hypothetical protein
MGSKAKTPAYDFKASQENQIWAAEQARKYGNVGVNSELGGYSWMTNPDGTQSINVNLSDADKQKLNLQNQALSNLNLDPTQAQNTYYNMSMRYMEPQLKQQQQDLETDLINKGIPIGSQSWNRAMGELQDNQQQALAQARDNALFQGQQYTSGNIGNINSLGASVYNPIQNMVQGQGGQFGGQYDTQYAAQVSNAQQNAANRNALLGAGIQAGGSILGGIYSDKRLKENIEFIENIHGINIYKFDYINGEKGQVGVMAQELLETPYKNAVLEDENGYYKVDYNKLPVLVNNKIKDIKNGK